MKQNSAVVCSEQHNFQVTFCICRRGDTFLAVVTERQKVMLSVFQLVAVATESLSP
jgi:hypothetical protein